MQRTGTLKKFFPEKGFGFIACDDGSPDLFAHKHALKGAHETAIVDGVKVSFISEVEARTGKPKASTWNILDGGAGFAAALGGMAAPDYGGLAAASFGAVRASPYGMPGMPMQGMMGTPGLPPGWEQVSDPATGNPYYCNRATGESSWTIPAAAAPAPFAAAPAPVMAPAPVPAVTLPPGWEQTNDPTSGKPYYFNRATSETRWEPPAV